MKYSIWVNPDYDRKVYSVKYNNQYVICYIDEDKLCRWYTGDNPEFDKDTGQVKDLRVPYRQIDDLFEREPSTVSEAELNLVMLKLFY